MKKTKKIIITITFLAASISLWCNEIESNNNKLFENYTYYLSLSDNNISTGTKLSFNLADIVFAAKNNEYNFGISLFTENYFKNFPCKSVIGNISLGNTFSKISSPGLSSSSSGFSSCYSAPDRITCSIPSFSTYSNPFRSFIELGYKKDKRIFKELFINGIFDFSSKDTYLSSKISFNFTNNFNLTNVITFCLFNIEENTSSTWYGTPYYKADKLSCLSSSLNIKIPFYSCNFSIFSYETPFGKIENIYRTEHEIKTEYFQFGAGFMYNNSLNIISPKLSAIEPSINVKGNIQCFIPVKLKNNEKLKIKTGITAFEAIPLLENINNLNFGISSILELPLTSIGTDVGLNYEIESNTSEINPASISVKIKNSWNIGVFDPAINIYSKYYFSKATETSENNSSININPDTKYYKADFNCTFIEDFIDYTTSFSFYCRNKKITDKKLKIGFSSNIKLKSFIIILKINGEFCI